MSVRQYPSVIHRSQVILVLAAAALGLCASAGAAVNVATRDAGGFPIAPRFRVVVVSQLDDADLQALARRGAVGLLVPGSGSLTDRAYALASLVRGADANPYVKHLPKGPPLIKVSQRTTVPRGSNVIVLSLPENRNAMSNDRRYPVAVIGYGFHGLLTSATTRIPGLAAITDIAPTALGRTHGSLHTVRSTAPLAKLKLLDGRIHANDRLKMPTLIIIACTLLLLAVVRPRLTVPAILAALLSSLAAGATHVTNEPLLVTIMLLGTLGGGALIARVCRDDRRFLATIVLVLILHVVLLIARPDWVAVTPLGPTQNSRFWGIGNQLETLLLAPVVAGAAVAARRYGMIGFGAFALAALVLVTDNRLGADGGGAIVFAVALAFIGSRIRHTGPRGFIVTLTLGVLAALAVILYNLQTPGPNHLRSVFSHGASGLASVIANRVPLAYLPAVQQWPLLFPIAAVFGAAFVLALRVADRRARDLVLGAGLAIGTSLLVNDSATYELAAGIAVIASLARFSVPMTPSGAQDRAASTPL